jgi:hypothetical protein
VSAELLRRAATVLRERAKSATGGPWTSAINDPEMCAVDAPSGRALVDVLLGDTDDRDAHPQADADAEYIALMHPPVALFLADLFDEVADSVEQEGGIVQDSTTAGTIDVARAILREPT